MLKVFSVLVQYHQGDFADGISSAVNCIKSQLTLATGSIWQVRLKPYAQAVRLPTQNSVGNASVLV